MKMLPITVGIVGHREIAVSDFDRVREQIKEILISYRRQAPSTPILLLTALAEGADQIAAEAGLEIEGVLVVAVLPMPSAEYEKDFKSPEKIATYHRLLSESYAVIQAQDFYEKTEMSTSLKNSFQDVGEYRTPRDEAYRDCGRFISQQSHILIAVWDGELSSLDVGTSDTVSHRLNFFKNISIESKFDHLWEQEYGVLLHILTKRNDEGVTLDNRLNIPKANKISVLTENFESRSWEDNKRDDAVDQFQLLNTLIGSQKEPYNSQASLTTRMLNVIDNEATKLQRRFKMHVSSLLVLGVLSLFLVDLQHDLSSIYRFFTTLLFLAVTVFIWFRFVKGSTKDRFYQFRALAEGLRVQLVWMECSVDRNASDQYLSGIPDVGWIPRTMRTARLVDILHNGSGSRDCNLNSENVVLTANRWVESQVQYFCGSSEEKGAVVESREKTELLERVSLTGIGIALFCLLLDGWRFLPGVSSFSESVIRGEQLTLHLSLSISAASAAYSQLMAYREIERQYEISADLFKKGRILLNSVEPTDISKVRLVQSVIAHIGIKALQETGMWLALKRDRAVHPI